MKYMNYRTAPLDQFIYACAYSIDNETGYCHLIQPPVKGKIIKQEAGWNRYVFIPCKKNSDELRSKSSAVGADARHYADTYEECLELYNSFVQERINHLQKFLEDAQKDFIEVKCQ